MNYYEHHIGDYDEATSHLTACEDGIYSRLIRKYYASERPLIADVPKLQRLVRAKSREEKRAVVTILDEFFRLEDDGCWHQATCDEVISAYLAGEPEREVKKANEHNRLKRHREERARLFKELTDAGQHATWNIGMAELREMVNRATATATATGKAAQPLHETAPATHATATQSPLPTPHTPNTNTPPGPPMGGGAGKPRASRKPPQAFAVTPEMRAWAVEHAPLVLIDAETEKFCDHTFANSITDWIGAWRNWQRKANEFAAARAQRTAAPPQRKSDALMAGNIAAAQRFLEGADHGG